MVTAKEQRVGVQLVNAEPSTVPYAGKLSFFFFHFASVFGLINDT